MSEPMTLDQQRAETDECRCGHWRAEHRHGDPRPGGTHCLVRDCRCDSHDTVVRAGWGVMYE